MHTHSLKVPAIFRRSLLNLSILSLTVGLGGCIVDATDVGQSEATTVTNPTHSFNEQTQQITGVVQGVLRDRVTGNPISGATISIGVRQATTDALGQYVIEDVPVTAGTADGGGQEHYHVTIDLRQVENNSGFDYPDFVYSTVAVDFAIFTPLRAEEMEGENLQQGTFHQVIAGLVSAYDLQVGKLSTGVAGTVVKDVNQFGLEPYKAVAGAEVRLVQMSDLERSNRVLATTVTDAEGRFSFERVEAGSRVALVAVYENAHGDEYATERTNIAAPQYDGEVLQLSLLNSGGVEGLRGEALKLTLLENQGPVLVSVTPENYSDIIASDDALEVRFTFNRDILENVYAQALDPSSSAIQGLYQDVLVQYNGTKITQQVLREDEEPKPGPTYSLAWDGPDTLVVTLHAVAPAAKYLVDISAAQGKLIDYAGRPASLTGSGSNWLNASATLEFTTRGSEAPGIPQPSVVAEVDSNDGVVLHWSPVTGAREYRVYRESIVVSPDLTDYRPGYEWVGSSGVSSFTDFPGFVYDGEFPPLPKQHRYVVTAVNADGIESAFSAVVGPIGDTVRPTFTVPGDTVAFGQEFMLDVSERIRAADSANSITMHVTDSAGDALTVEVASAIAGSQALEVELSATPDVPDAWAAQMQVETLGRFTTGWNGIWREESLAAFDPVAIEEVDELDLLPALSTGLCMTLNAQTEGQFFTRDSSNYADHIPLSFSVDQIVGDEVIEEDGVWYVYTGPNGVCNSVTGLLNYFYDGTEDFDDDGIWHSHAQGAAADANLNPNNFAAMAGWALRSANTGTDDSPILRANLLNGVSLVIDDRHFRLANRAESLTQLALAGVDEFWTNPTDLSLPTLSQLTQGLDDSRPGSAAALAPEYHFLLAGEAPADARPDVLYQADDTTLDHHAWRGTRLSPNTTAHLFTFRVLDGTFDQEELQSDVAALGDSVSRLYSFTDHYEVDILTISADAVEDIAGNANSGVTLVREFRWDADLSEWKVQDVYRN